MRSFSWTLADFCWKRNRLPTPVFLGFPCGSPGNEFAYSEGDLGSIPGLGRSSGEGKGYPRQYSGLENSMDCIDHGVAKSQTRLSDFHNHFQTTAPALGGSWLYIQIPLKSPDLNSDHIRIPRGRNQALEFSRASQVVLMYNRV